MLCDIRVEGNVAVPRLDIKVNLFPGFQRPEETQCCLIRAQQTSTNPVSPILRSLLGHRSVSFLLTNRDVQFDEK